MLLRLIVLLGCLLLPRAFGELIIGKPMWGFDGTAVPDCFNLVTFEVRNNGAQPFEGAITFDNGGTFAGATATYQQPVFLAPGTARTVQFYPFIARSAGDWRIRWEKQGSGFYPADGPKTGAPATVILLDSNATGARALKMRAFDSANFPPTVSATDGLHAAILDHQPRWDPARREAFLGWLKRGGTLHLLPGPDGVVPEFTEELAVLNGGEKTTSVGAGQVVRHAIGRTEIDEAFLTNAGYGPRVLQDREDYVESGDARRFSLLANVTKPKIAWSLIYLLTLVYIVIIGPVFYFQRKRDFRYVLGGFLLTVALFAWIFTMIGRRGYGEKQVYHSVALARSIEGDQWDVRHWVHAFATSGDEYRFAFPGASHLFAPYGREDSLRSVVTTGKDAAFTADIPLFSSRSFLHQGVLRGPSLEAKLERAKQSDNLSVITADFPKLGGLDPKKVVLQQRESYYPMEGSGAKWKSVAREGVDFRNGFNFNNSDYDYSYSYRYSGYAAEQARSELEAYSGPLARILTESGALRRPLRPGFSRIYLYAPAPASFGLQSEEFALGIGYVLFVHEFPTPPNF